MDDFPIQFKTDVAVRYSTRTPESLGAVVKELRPSLANLIAGGILGVIFTVAGIGLMFVSISTVMTHGISEESAVAVLLSFLLPLLMFALAGISVWLCTSLASFRLYLCEDGFHVRQHGQSMVFAWDEIISVEETLVQESAPLVRGPLKLVLPKLKSREILVKRCDGKSVSCGPNLIAKVQDFSEPLRAIIQERGIPWHTKEERR